eukprot:1155089_1
MSFDVPYEFDERNTVIIQHALLNKSLRVLPNNPRRIDHNGSTGKFARWHADPQEEGEKVRFKSTRTNKYLRIIQNRDKYIVDVAGTGGKFTVFNPETIENGQILLESDAFPGVYIAVDNKGVRTGSGGKLCNLRIMQQNEDSGSSTESDEEDDKKSGMFYSTAGGPDDADADEEYEMVQTKKAQSPQQEEDEEDEDSIIIHSEQKDIEGDAVTPAGGDSNDSHDSHDDDDDDDVVILNTNNGSNHNTKPPMDNSVPPSIEPNNGSETLNRLETKYGPLTSHASPQPGAARVSTNAFDECSEEDMMSPQDAKAKAEFWDEVLPTWREKYSKKNCESRKNSANAQTKEYCKMYLKYWKSIELHHNKTRKRKREDSGDE